jgi:glycosyltransferase involved in cell wall biosynthesis
LIAFAPDYRQVNPFQEMLYSERSKQGVVAFPIEMEPFETEGALSRFQDRESIFHLHWTTPIISNASNEAEALVRVDAALRAIDSFKERGGRFVWTIHEVLPNDTRYGDLEAYLCQELAHRADLVHMMCEATIEEIGDLYNVPAARTVVIPHSGYDGVYPNAPDRDQARARMAIGTDDVALLALEAVRGDKSLYQVFEAFDRAVTREPRLLLIVAGKTDPFEEPADIEEALAAHPRVIANFDEILAADLPYLYGAADVAVMPLREGMRPGSLLLAYTFGVPVVAPRVGCLRELLDDGASIGFDVGATGALEDALVASRSLKHVDARRAAHRIAKGRPVQEMSIRFFEALDGIFQGIP